jgi:hypothetical protein
VGPDQEAELKARPLCAGASVESSMRSLRNDVCIEWTTIAVSPPPAKSDRASRFGRAARAIAMKTLAIKCIIPKKFPEFCGIACVALLLGLLTIELAWL